MSEPLENLRAPRFSQHMAQGHSFRVAQWPAVRGQRARPLLFFSGIGANIELLAPFLEEMRGRDVITFDMPGVGGTPPFSRPYRLSTMAKAAREILTDLGIADVDVMGVSWGGMLAQEFAYRGRQSVKNLVLAATSAGMPMIPGDPSTLVKMLGSHRYADALSIDAYLQTLYGGSNRDLGTYAARMQAPTSIGYWHQVMAIIGWTSVRKLTRVRAPTLILMGADDRLLPPSNGQILKFLSRNARLEVLAGAGHLFVLTHRDAAVKMIEGFLDRSSVTVSARATPGTPIHAGAAH